MINLYSKTSDTRRKEIDLRKELNEFLFGSLGEIPKGKNGLFRKIRRDSSNNPVRCNCRDTISDEPERDFFCPSCWGIGFLWDEYKIVYYKNEKSYQKGDDILFYFEYDGTITSEDYIVEVKLEKTGVPESPITRYLTYEIVKAIPYRSDDARLEFWTVIGKYRRDWSVWYGVKHRQI